MSLVSNGKRFNVTLGGTVTKGSVYRGVTGGLGGVYMKGGASGEVVPVALEGAFQLATATTAAATKVFGALDKVYSVISTGALTNAAATSAVALGVNVGPATTSAAGAQAVIVKICSF